ncbi:MAG: formylglycine-generating enzyme family protein, partial [Treponema sp.]
MRKKQAPCLMFLRTSVLLLSLALLAGCKNPAEHTPVPSVTPPANGGGSTPAQITITVAGDEHVTLKTEKTFTTDKGKTWKQLKAQAEGKIDYYEENYGFDKWALTDAGGQNLTDSYVFNENATVFVVSKQTSAQITITVAGDENVILKSDRTFEVEKGKTWNVLKTDAEKKIQGYKDNNYKFKEWRLTDNTGELLNDSYTTPFNNDTTVFVVSQPIMITLAIKGDHVTIDPPASITVQKGTKWSAIKAEITGKVHANPNFKVIAWKTRGKTGNELEDTYEFKGNTIIYAETQQINVTVTIKGNSHVQLVEPATITKPYGVTWKDIKTLAKKKINSCDEGYAISAWKKGSLTGSDLADIDKFEEDTEVYAITQAVPVSEGVKVTP